MKRSIKKFERSLVFLLKMTLFASLFLTFFFSFYQFGNNWWLLRFSRTAGVTMVTFIVLGISLMSVYGGYAIGKQKSKMIVQSMILATVMTDLVTYLQLSIMNTNEHNNHIFQFESPIVFLGIIVVQIMLILVFVYFGNFVYFSMNPPEKCCVITSSQYSLNRVLPKINRYKKQYKIDDIIDYNAKDIFDVILRNDTIFIYEVPIHNREQLVEFCYQNMKNIYYNPELSDIVVSNAKHVMLDDKSFMVSQIKELSLEQRFVKRGIDILLSLIALIVTSPIMLACAIAIKADDGGKVLFKQQRATKDGYIFKVYKFRTMREPDEKAVHVSASANDNRITKVGNILRKFRVDELPQIINILKGEMSIVGPRPEMLENIYRYTQELPEFEYRLRVKAGLTGLAQVVGKYNTSPKDKLILDLLYIEKYSIWQDIKLIFQTLIVFLKSSDSTEGFQPDIEIQFVKHDMSHKKD